MISKKSAAALVLLFSSHSAWAVETKMTCPEVEATELKCQEFDKETADCDALVQEGIKAKVEAAKHEFDECKKKNSVQYVIKCKKELKNSTTAVNTPKQVAGKPIEKELLAKPESACAKADALGKSNALCKGPKKVLKAIKDNCIKV